MSPNENTVLLFYCIQTISNDRGYSHDHGYQQPSAPPKVVGLDESAQGHQYHFHPEDAVVAQGGHGPDVYALQRLVNGGAGVSGLASRQHVQ